MHRAGSRRSFQLGGSSPAIREGHEDEFLFRLNADIDNPKAASRYFGSGDEHREEGKIVGYAFAAQHPERVTRVVLMGSLLGIWS
ncbi:MAG: hypothetical protein ABW003_12035 [Microvirga sp.]